MHVPVQHQQVRINGCNLKAPLTPHDLACIGVCCHVQGQGIARQRQAIVNGLRDSVMVRQRSSNALCMSVHICGVH